MLACCFFACIGCICVPCTRMGTRSSIEISCAFDKSLLEGKERQSVTCYDSALRDTTACYKLRQPVTCSDSLRRLTTARYVLQRVTCWDSGCVSRQYVTCYALRQRVTCYNSVWSVTTACFVLRQRATLTTGCYVLHSCIIHKNTFSWMLQERVCSTNPILDHVKQIFSLHEELQLN